jgi:hypothetical protein
MHYNVEVAWEVEVTDEFKTWWSGLAEAERISLKEPYCCWKSVAHMSHFRTAAE